ncbi:hypothetical protein [[Phormidium ambiguum] IAM M-71]|nr:hypothetical protein [Phormidium ambiguum]
MVALAPIVLTIVAKAGKAIAQAEEDIRNSPLTAYRLGKNQKG